MKRKLVRMTVSVKYPTEIKVRRNANLIEDLFEEKYNQPMVIPIPDEIDPNFPRIQLQSKNGHSNIAFSQISVDFNVGFDGDYESDYGLCEKYVRERIDMIIKFFKDPEVNKEKIYYTGLSTQIKFEFEKTEKVIEYMKRNFDLKKYENASIYDYSQKVSIVESEKYFQNIAIGNYRDYQQVTVNPESPSITSFVGSEVVSSGLLITLDVNDRYHYNEFGGTYGLDELEKRINYLFDQNRLWVDKKLSEVINLEEG